jgi:hypothetical protein
MSIHLTACSRSTCACLALACLLAGVAAGCRQQAAGDLQELVIANRRFVIDTDRNVVRVYGRLENIGDHRFRQVEVRAFLKSTGGNRRGENLIVLENIAPREKRTFSLSITSHSRVNDVILEIRQPEQP